MAKKVWLKSFLPCVELICSAVFLYSEVTVGCLCFSFLSLVIYFFFENDVFLEWLKRHVRVFMKLQNMQNKKKVQNIIILVRNWTASLNWMPLILWYLCCQVRMPCLNLLHASCEFLSRPWKHPFLKFPWECDKGCQFWSCCIQNDISFNGILLTNLVEYDIRYYRQNDHICTNCLFNNKHANLQKKLCKVWVWRGVFLMVL